jgi:hypothetical protein
VIGVGIKSEKKLTKKDQTGGGAAWRGDAPVDGGQHEVVDELFLIEELLWDLLLVHIKCQFHAPKCHVNIWNNHVFTLSTNLVPRF